jgi:hypothetical protein
MLTPVVAAVIATAALGQVSSGQMPVGGQAVFTGPSASAPEITASGRGESKISPTSSAVSITVTTRAPTAAQAAADNATRLESTLKSLRAQGLTANQLTTAGYSVAQNYEFTRESPRVPAGFIARNTIRAEVRRLDELGKVIDAALAGGATEIAGVQFLAADSEQAHRSALADAVRQARADAEAIARAAGGSLGRLIALNTDGGTMMRPAYLEAGGMDFAARVSTSITPRDLTIAAQVSGRWEFIPGTAR